MNKNTNIPENFYKSRKWRNLALSVIKEHHGECYICRQNGKYSKAVLVHHVRPLKEFPNLAYSRTDELGNIQLMPLCFDCHERLHQRGKYRNTESYTNSEKW